MYYVNVFFFQRIEEQSIRTLLQFLKHNDDEIVTIVAGTFENLSAEKPHVKHLIYNAGGLECFFQTVATRKK